MDDGYRTFRSKPKADVVLLKIDSADASVIGTSFKFLMDLGASKIVISMKYSKIVSTTIVQCEHEIPSCKRRGISIHECCSCDYMYVWLHI